MRSGVIMILAAILAPGSRGQAAFDDVFARLDLTQPGLAKVKDAVEADDLPSAAAELKAYFRAREKPIYITDRFSRPPRNPDYNTGGADKVLRREFAFVGKPATLTHDIDWNADPLHDIEWPIELNRHGIWVTLARAYWHTHDEEYIEDLAYQLNGWLTENPRPDSPRQSKWTWRTLECGIRLGGSWPEVFFRAIDSEHFTPELLCLMLEGMWQQCDFLMRHHGGGNWLVCERSALVTMGVVYPEFTDSQTWLKTGWDVLSRELESQVYPDGAQIELTPHYHSATLSSFRRAYDIAERNDAEIPPAYRDRMELMYEYLMYVVKPDGYIPMFNDSDHGNMRGWMRDGAQRFGRQDMLYVATGGEEGTPPDGPSHAFEWAGQYVMRSGWTNDDLYLALDAGPYGLGHQHEDKLTVDVWAYGQEMILDPGRYTYAGGKWRSYFLHTVSHPTMLVNGQGQNRRRTPRATWVPRESRHNRWITNDDLDFAAGSYEDGYAGAEDVIHVRKVVFVKPDYFIVSDFLLPQTTTDREHKITVQWQLARPGAKLDGETTAVHSVGPEANVLVIPADTEGLSVTMHEGEEDPPAGWIAWSLHRALKEPATLVRYSRKGMPPIAFDTVVYPYRGEEPPDIEIRKLPVTDATCLEIRGPHGRDICYVSHSHESEPATVGDTETDAEVLVLRYGDGDQPEAIAFVGGTSLPATPRDDSAPVVNVAENRVGVAGEQPAAFVLRYGYAVGGGYLFESPPTEPSKTATLRIQDAKYDVPYAYEVLAETDAGARVIQRGTVLIPQPRAFDFEDGTLQGWEGPSALLVEGADGSAGALRIDAPAAFDATYISVSRPQKLKPSEQMHVSFKCRAPVEDGGDWFYAKVTLREDTGADWSAYFASKPSENWQQVKLGLGDFRGDTQDDAQQGKPMPAGLKIHRVSVILRKGKTAAAVAAALELDDFRIGE